MMDRYMNKIQQICLSTVLSLAMVGLAQAASMCKWVDKDGHVHYSQQPPADSNYEKLNVKTRTPDSSGSPSGPTYSTPGSSSSNGAASDVIKEEVAKGEETRKKNCEIAKKSLEQYTAFRRMRDKDGNVVYLDDNERQKRIDDAKAAIKEFCE